MSVCSGRCRKSVYNARTMRRLVGRCAAQWQSIMRVICAISAYCTRSRRRAIRRCKIVVPLVHRGRTCVPPVSTISGATCADVTCICACHYAPRATDTYHGYLTCASFVDAGLTIRRLQLRNTLISPSGMPARGREPALTCAIA